ncbi:MAG: hypothetical protein WAZ48_14240 [Lysobacteraceae bacterium]
MALFLLCWWRRLSAAVIGFKHDVRVILAASFVALSVSALHAEWVKPVTFFALVRELLSLAQRK